MNKERKFASLPWVFYFILIFYDELHLVIASDLGRITDIGENAHPCQNFLNDCPYVVQKM